MLIPSKPVLDFIDEIVKVAAVVVGGVWTYVNYVRGRTHRTRLEIDLTGELVEQDGEYLFFGDCKAKNVGLSKAPLNDEGTGIALFALRLVPRADGSMRMLKEEIVVLPLFPKHGWIEPGETISDPVTATLPKGTEPLAGVRLDAMISNGKITWNASKVFQRKKSGKDKEEKEP